MLFSVNKIFGIAKKVAFYIDDFIDQMLAAVAL